MRNEIARNRFRVFLSTGSGRVGLNLFILLIVISGYVLLTYPLDFGLKFWSDPVFWADNPKAAPPIWVAWLDPASHLEHRVFKSTQPAIVNQNGESGSLYQYIFNFDHKSDMFPSFVSLTLHELSYQKSPPRILVSIIRPDRYQLPLFFVLPTGPLPGEAQPYVRYTETPFRLRLSSETSVAFRVSDFLAAKYGILVPATDLLRRGVESALFGVPTQRDGIEFTVLKGTYTLMVEMIASDPKDRLGSVKIVVGGSAFGLLGTDGLGRDIGVGLLFGFPIALFLGLITSILATALGSTLGMIGGLYGGKTDSVVQRASDIAANVPLLPLLIYLTFSLQSFLPKLWIVVFILVAFGWPGLAITVRSMLLQIKGSQLVEAAVSMGASKTRIMLKHVFPQIAPFIFGQMIFFAPSAILAEAGLSFLGLGDPSIPTWGQILESGFRNGAVYLGYWWWVLPPGLLIVLTAMTFVLVSIGLEPVINPRLRRLA